MRLTDEQYREGLALQRRLTSMKLSELLALDPTLDKLRYVNEVIGIGYGSDADEYDIQEVKELLEKENLPKKRIKVLPKKKR